MRLTGNSMPTSNVYQSNDRRFALNNIMDTKKYTLAKTGEQVDEERWAWGVVYEDNTELLQFNPDGSFHQIGEVNQEAVKLFVMYKPSDPSKRIDLIVPQGAKIIHKYRNIKPYYLDDFVKVYLFGYKKGDQYAYHFILPDDRMVISDVDNVNLELFKLSK